jgi:hypothetical protein
LNPFSVNYPEFESVYDSVPGFGREKSVSYRIYKGAKRLNVWRKVETKAEKRKFRGAIAALKLFRYGRARRLVFFGTRLALCRLCDTNSRPQINVNFWSRWNLS